MFVRERSNAARFVERSNAYAVKFVERSNAYAVKFVERSNAYVSRTFKHCEVSHFERITKSLATLRTAIKISQKVDETNYLWSRGYSAML